MTEELDKEIWRTIPSAPNYEASSYGRIRRGGERARGIRVGYVLRQHMMLKGHLCVSVSVYKGVMKTKLVHRLVAAAFHGLPQGCDNLCVAHIDGDPTHNVPSNLRWATVQENSMDAIYHGVSKVGEKNLAAKLTNEEVYMMKLSALEENLSPKELADKYGVSSPHVSAILRGAWRRHYTLSSTPPLRRYKSSKEVNEAFDRTYTPPLVESPTIVTGRAAMAKAIKKAESTYGEVWKTIPKFERYQASNLGRIRVCLSESNGQWAGRIFSNKKRGRYGHRMVTLTIRDQTGKPKEKTIGIHRLVCAAFNGGWPDDDRMHAAHFDGDPANNTPDNLRWATAKENTADRERHGTMCHGIKSGMAKISDAQVFEIIRLREQQVPAPKIAALYGIKPERVYGLANGRRRRCLAGPGWSGRTSEGVAA